MAPPSWLAVGIALATLPLVAPASPPHASDPGCEASASEAQCTWTAAPQPALGGVTGVDALGRELHALPTFGRTLATIRVEYGDNEQWSYDVLERNASANRSIAYVNGPQDGRSGTTPTPFSDTTFYLADPTANYTLAFDHGAGASFTIHYSARKQPEGVAPARPAATRDEPQLRGTAHDAQYGSMDLLAGWLDDARVGDGVFEAHLAVRDLKDAPPPDAALGPKEEVWGLFFQVNDASYHIAWRRPDLATTEARVQWAGCDLQLNSAQGQGAVGSRVGFGACVFDNATSTLTAILPERALGDPAAGALFTAMHADSYEAPGASPVPAAANEEGNMPADSMTVQRFPFALGGPAVWDQLNGCRFCVAPAPWYAAPLAPENLPNTLQVLGALVAIATFLVGLLLVARRRRALRAMLDEVEATAARHDADAREGIAALGALQARYSGLMRRGDITESQYQVVSQRIAFVATQLVMRRDLSPTAGSSEAPR